MQYLMNDIQMLCKLCVSKYAEQQILLYMQSFINWKHDNSYMGQRWRVEAQLDKKNFQMAVTGDEMNRQ
jgi:hypothetical protein